MAAQSSGKVVLLLVIILTMLLPFSACSSQTESPEKDQTEFNQKDKIRQIACGDEFTLILYNTGKVYAIGKNTSGQLGVGDFKDRYVLIEVLLPEAIRRLIKHVQDRRYYICQATGYLLPR